MAKPQLIDVGRLVDEQKFGGFALVFLVVATVVLVGDGFDLFAMPFVAPELVKDWHVARPALAPVLSAGIFGLLFGAPIFGYVGDRYGRKRAIITGGIVYGLFTLASMAATTLNELVALRFITGLGLGGVIPNVIALTAEFAPKRRRAMYLIIVNFGVPAGATLPGLIAALLVGRFGWPVIFLVGGILPLVIALVAYVSLPESIKFLAQHPERDAEIRRIAHILAPQLRIAPGARFVAPASTARTGFSPRRLFAGGLAVITPLIWLSLTLEQLANFFVTSWLPTVLQSTGASTAEAALSTTMYGVGGLLGGLVLTFIMDRHGVVPMALLFVLGTPLIAALGMVGLNTLWLVSGAAGFCIVGINFSMNTTMGMIYPTPVRSNGAGWAMAFGRIGSIAGPLLGGVLLSLHLPVEHLFIAPATSLGLGAIACIILATLCHRRFGSNRLDDAPASAAASPEIARRSAVARKPA